MKYITLNFRCGGKVKLPANILKSIDVPDDFTVNKKGGNTNKRICIGDGCYVDSLDKNITLEEQLPGKKCYTSDDFSNNQLVDDGGYDFLEEILNNYSHIVGLISFATDNGTIDDGFAYDGEAEIELVPIAYKSIGEEEDEIAYVYSDTEELDVGTEVYGDKTGILLASDGEYMLYEDISVNVSIPLGVYGFEVENGKVSELLAPEEEGGGEEEEE